MSMGLVTRAVTQAIEVPNVDKGVTVGLTGKTAVYSAVNIVKEKTTLVTMWMVLVTRAVIQVIEVLNVDKGCDPGYQGALCTQAITKGVKVGRAQKNINSETSKLNVTLIAVGVVVVVIVAAIAGLLVYRYRKSLQPRKYNDLEDDSVMIFSELPSNG
ncbi:hypothetical protein ElyMa_005859800 [Elysia marginata]|uniref:Uncharacterized protein n=1 Tax=Elysia marginata TaxID=1093978 RepID=A0AAV4G060_9GAST|nr:hypothetical protein ElyMa_005859800 [Elysia marginata]